MISIIVPVYNEEEMLPLFVETFFKDIKLDEEYELIFVNDGSTDNTLILINQAMVNHSQIKLLSYESNMNLGYALPKGFRIAKGRIIVTMDSDLAHPPSLISNLVKKIDQGFDVAIGSRYHKAAGVKGVPLHAHYLSKLVNNFTRIVLLTKIKDATSGFRAYKTEIIKNITTKEKGFEVELEIFVQLYNQKVKIAEVPFNSSDRSAGKSKVDLLKHGPRYIFSMIRIFCYRLFF